MKAFNIIHIALAFSALFLYANAQHVDRHISGIQEESATNVRGSIENNKPAVEQTSSADARKLRKASSGKGAPSVKAPSAKAPSVKAPSAKAPSVKAPSAKAPSVKAPSSKKAPSVKAPSAKTKAPSAKRIKVRRVR